MSTNLTAASNQWASRPADERYWGVSDALAATTAQKNNARNVRLSYRSLTVAPQGADMVIMGEQGRSLRLTNYAFGQLCQRAKSPAGFLSELTAPMAADILNDRLDRDGDGQLLVDIVLGEARAITSSSYTRLWNADIFARLAQLPPNWRVPPGRPVQGVPTRIATDYDVLARSQHNPLAIRVGDTIGPSGIYASDRDMFAFMVDESTCIDNPADPNTPLQRGFFLWNSEVGDKSFGVTSFFFDAVCGNHIVWGASGVTTQRIRHTGRHVQWTARQQLDATTTARVDVRAITDQLSHLQSVVIGKDKVAVGNAAARVTGLPKTIIMEAYEVAEGSTRYGDPRTAWGINNGLTELSQREGYASKRAAIDNAAGLLLDATF
jgi:hypothetical protein